MSDKREYGTIHQIGKNLAKVCGCGSVHFHLLQTGITECAKCQEHEYVWRTKEDDSQLCLTADTSVEHAVELDRKARHEKNLKIRHLEARIKELEAQGDEIAKLKDERDKWAHRAERLYSKLDEEHYTDQDTDRWFNSDGQALIEAAK